MPDVAQLMAPLGAECDPDDTIAEILELLRAQHPLPVLVTRDGEACGTVGLEAAVLASASLGTTRTAELMTPLPARDGGIAAEAAAAAMVETGSAATLVTEPEGGIFSKRSRPVGLLTRASLLAAIGRNVVDKAPMKMLRGHRDLGFNVPISPCQRNCPIKQDIATYVDYVSQGRYVDSWRVIHETNPFPSMLGRICNHPCETDCKRGWDPGEDPVTIRSLKRFATDFSFKQGMWIDYKIAPAKGKRVAVVGAGPSGLTAPSTCASRATRSCSSSARPRWAACSPPASRPSASTMPSCSGSWR